MRSVVLVVLATLSLAGCSAPAAETAPTVPQATDLATEGAVWTNLTGKITGNPVVPGEVDFPLEVAKGAVEVAATLTWTSQLADLRLALIGPDGEVVETGFGETATQEGTATLEPPASGTWTVRVSSMRAVDEPFELAARVLLIVPQHNVLADSYEVGGASLFKEINLIMDEGASFNWSFTATSPVHYDIHSHENGETTYHERGVAAEGGGAFTAEKRQIYSLLWSPPDEPGTTPTPATVEYRVEGAFRVHSHSQ